MSLWAGLVCGRGLFVDGSLCKLFAVNHNLMQRFSSGFVRAATVCSRAVTALSRNQLISVITT